MDIIMEQLKKLIEDSISEKLYQFIISNPSNKDGITKIKVRPIMLKEKLLFQVSEFIETKVLHENFIKQDLVEKIMNYMMKSFKQLEVETMDYQATVLISKKGKITIKKRQIIDKEQKLDFSHNRIKRYILEENKPVDFLIDLGVQNKDGKIVKSKYDKFKQINRYLEFIQDILPVFPKDKTISIIDFGCGKSYLTFAMYYYLKVLNQYDIQVIGLDLKKDVIEKCNYLKDKYGYDGLTFLMGDISTYEGKEEVDMVVSLHACDTATDYAIAKAIKWNAKVILAVPCCQHEANKQIQCEELQPALKYGLIKERISALITDAIRANILEEQGYATQILEFIDMEHTPKNILIRGVKDEKDKISSKNKLDSFMKFLNVDLTLANLIDNQ